MTDTLISQLLDFGALGIFAGFLIWQHLGMQRRLDKLTTGFQTQLKEIENNYDTRLEQMRDRHDDSIKEIRDEAGDRQKEHLEMRDKTHNDIVQKLDATITRLDLGLSEMRIKYAEDRAKS